MKSSGSVVRNFSIPPHPPKPVAEAAANFERLGDEFGAVIGEIDDATQAATRAKLDALQAVADAATAGKPAKVDPSAVEREHAERIASLQARREALEVAVDAAGDTLAVAVSTHRAEWVGLLEENAAAAAVRYRDALAEAKAALGDFAPTSNAIAWLGSFEHVPAIRGTGQAQFPGGRVKVHGVVGIGPLSGEHDPNVLLDLAAKATEPAEVPQARKHRVVVR